MALKVVTNHIDRINDSEFRDRDKQQRKLLALEDSSLLKTALSKEKLENEFS